MTATESAFILKATGLYLRFGGLEVTRFVDLDVKPGEIHALIGPNGAGKTTVLGILNGDLAPMAGSIVFRGVDVTSWPMHRRARLGMARTFQVTSVFAEMTAADNVAMAVQGAVGTGVSIWRPARRDAVLREPAMAALETVGLAGVAGTPAGVLAHGQQRKLELAMALAADPAFLLLDEPMAGIGGDEAEELTDLLAGLRDRIPMLLVEHDMDVVFRLADRVSVLADGSVIASGEPEAVRSDKVVIEAYLGEADGHAAGPSTTTSKGAGDA